MKISDGFDARRLRNRRSGNWGARLVTLIGVVLAIAGAVLAIAGVVGLVGHTPALGELNSSTGGAIALTAGGLVMAYVGIRVCRRRRHRPSGLNLSPHLMKKHD